MAKKHMKKYSTSLAIKEIQIKTKLRFLFTPVEMARTQTATNVGENVGKKEPSYTAGGNVNLYNHYGKQYGGSSKS
jgi:hypothetical protein